MDKGPVWKQPQALVLIGGGGILALATIYLLATTWAAPAPTATPLPPRFADENALVAANAEAKGGTPGQDNVMSVMGPIPPPTADDASGSKTEPERFNPNEIIAEAQRSLDEARDQADQAQQDVEDVQADLDKPDPDGPK